MKYCCYCGSPVDQGAKFCSSCGSKLAESSAAAPVAPAAPVTYAPPVTYAAPAAYAAPSAPALQLKTNRGLGKYIFLSLITFGIYALVVWSVISSDINTVASKYDGKRTTHFCLMYFVFSWLTLGISPLVWSHKISNRIGNELSRRGINYSVSAGTFWGWGVLGSLIIVGPFIYLHKIFKAMNLICADYNAKG